MTTERKLRIARAITKVLDWNYELPVNIIESRIKINPFLNKPIFSFPYEKHLSSISLKSMLELKQELSAVDVYSKSVYKRRFVHVEIDRDTFVRDALTTSDICKPLLNESQKVIVEHSSPNIAKPFHMGHLRSTVIGNFIANVNQFLGNDVVRMNYLGDWGVQFGLLKLGMKECGLQREKITSNPLKTLLGAYIRANEMAEESAEIVEKARQIFHDLEYADEDSPDLEEWRTIRQFTLEELVRIYDTLGVKFDEYSWESDYSARRIKPVIDQLKEKQIVREENDGALVTTVFKETIPVIKHDGCTLYLARDIAAALDRHTRHKFDKMYYVVDAMQRGHFVILREVLKRLESECADKIEHLSFGRVMGASTRKGKAFWLDDILVELYKIMEQKQRETPTTKVPVGGETTRILATSCLITFDLKKRRNVHYKFDADTVAQLEGFTGARLQYCHCRLHSLVQVNSNVPLPAQCHPELLSEPEAMKIVTAISKFNESLLDTYHSNESCIFINYLFELCESVNQAFPKLKVKGQPMDIASQRLLLFTKAKHCLKTGLEIAGMKPLEGM